MTPKPAAVPPPADFTTDPPRRADLERILGAAFFDDKVWEWAIGAGRQFERRIGALLGLGAVTPLRRRTVWSTPGGEACAVWLDPETSPVDPPVQQLRSLPRAAWASGRYAPRGLRLLSTVQKAHPHDRPHWYLEALGAIPQAQGKGFGSAVLRPVLDHCDEVGLPAYLENSKERNLAFYARHGFEVIEELKVPKGCPPMWGMWREPRV